jgi:hypothetical protein
MKGLVVREASMYAMIGIIRKYTEITNEQRKTEIKLNEDI